MARNNYVTYQELECPSTELACVLYPTTKTANLPAKGFPGQQVFVTDMLAVDGSLGVVVAYQPSTQVWKKLF